MAGYRPPKGNSKLFKDFCKDFPNKQKMRSKAIFLLGNFNLNTFGYDTKEIVKNIFILIFQNGFLSLIQRPTGVTKTSVIAVDHTLTNKVLGNKIQSGIIKTDISRHHSPIFTILTTNGTCSLEKTKFLKSDIIMKMTVLILLNYYWKI